MNLKTKEAIRKLANNLVQDCQEMDRDLNFVNLTITQFVDDIETLFEGEKISKEEIQLEILKVIETQHRYIKGDLLNKLPSLISEVLPKEIAKALHSKL